MQAHFYTLKNEDKMLVKLCLKLGQAFDKGLAIVTISIRNINNKNFIIGKNKKYETKIIYNADIKHA